MSQLQQKINEIEALKTRFDSANILEKPKLLEQIGTKSFELTKALIAAQSQSSNTIAMLRDEVASLQNRLTILGAE